VKGGRGYFSGKKINSMHAVVGRQTIGDVLKRREK
jgi:hypothetical protein